MKKKIWLTIGAFVIFTMLLLIGFALAAELENEETIVISYMNKSETTSTTKDLDKTAYADGKQIVKPGEKFTLPTTSSDSYTGKEGFQLVWYTENGRTYKAGEEVSFDKDTKLFRAVAKECYTMSEVNFAMTHDSKCAILMADISTNSGISVEGQGQSVLILNGYSLNISKNGGIMGAQRSGKHVYGEGTINITNPDGKKGEYYVFNDQSHSYNGSANKTVVGIDVTINAPNFWLGADGDGSYNNHFPWTRIYGNVNCYGLYKVTNVGNRAPFIEVFDGATVTVNGPTLFKDSINRKNGQYYSFNTQAFDLRIYGGTFNLPSEAAQEAFWTNDNIKSYVDGSVTYSNYGLHKFTKDNIKIFGGTFILPDNAAPAIADYITADYIASSTSSGTGLYSNSDTSTYYIAYLTCYDYTLAFEKYTIGAGSYGKLTVTDNIDGSLSGTYYYQMEMETITFTDEYDNTVKKYSSAKNIVIFEKIEKTAEDGSVTSEYVVTDKFKVDYGMQGALLFSNDILAADMKLQESNGAYVVVPAGCEHVFEKTVVEASCQSQGTETVTCTLCGYSSTTILEQKTDHNWELLEHKEATLTSSGSKSYKCADCGATVEKVYNFDPKHLEIAVKIRHDDDTFEEITVLASEIFEFTVSGSNENCVYTLCGIKEFGDYKIRNIYGLTIPKGILSINITTHNYEKYQNVEYGLVELNFADGASVDVQNIGNLRKVEKITVGKNAEIVFGPSCSYYNPNNEKRDMQKIATIDLSAGNHKVTFMNSAFSGRGTVANVIFGENSSYDFRSSAFYNCAITGLELLPTSTYTMGSTCFYGNDMTELVFADNFDITIGANAFENCPNLATVKFGANSSYVLESNAFKDCAITSLEFNTTSTYTFGSACFYGNDMTELVFADNCDFTIGANMFEACPNLAKVKFGANSSYVLGSNAFKNAAITSIEFDTTSTYTFGSACFYGNDMTELVFPDNYDFTIGANMFEACPNLAKVKFGANSSYVLGSNAFKNAAITSIEFDTTSTYTFGSACFYGNDMTEIVFPDNYDMTIGDNMFEACPNLTSVTFGQNSNYTIGNNAFRYSPIPRVALSPNSTYVIGSQAFTNAALAEIDMSAGNMTVTLNKNAFNCWLDKKITGAVTSIKFGENSTYVINEGSFNDVLVTELKLAPNSNYTFKRYFINGGDNKKTFKTFDASANNINLTVEGEAFRYHTAFDTLKLNGEGSTYTFSGNAFCDTMVSEITLGKGSTYTFNNCFNGTTSIKKIDASADNLTVTVNGYGWGKSTLETALINGKNSTYTFNSDALRTAGIKELVLGEGSTYVFGSNSLYDTALLEITLGKDSTYTFNSCLGGKTPIKKIDASADNMTVTVNGYGWGKSTLETALINGKNCTYNFNKDALRSAGIKELVLGEGSTYLFDSNSLYDTALLEITLGKDSTYTFNNCLGGKTPIKKIDASADNINLTVNNYGFGKNTIETVLINGKNSTYTFNKEAFTNSIFTELTLGEGSTYTFNSGSMTNANNIQKLDASADNIVLTVGNNVFQNKASLVTLDISGKNSEYTFGKETVRNSPVAEIKFGEGSTYSFGQLCFYDNKSITTLDFTASNVTATFGSQAFDGRKTVTYLEFGKNSSYTIGDYAFRNTAPTNDIVFSNTSTFKIGREAFRYADFASIAFEENPMQDGQYVEFTGIDAFLECDKATLLYIGKNNAITNYPFRTMKALETIYIMEGVTHTSENEFSYAGAADYSTPLYVYNHSYDFEFLKGTFNECDGVFLYTVTDNIGTRTDVFSNCSDQKGYKGWTVYLGVPHPMVEGFISAPNCTEEGITGWVSDTAICDCSFQIAETKVVNVYEKKHNITSDTEISDYITYEIKIAPPLGHDYGVEAPIRIDWIYVNNNYFANAKNKHNCTICGVDYLGKDIENSALFEKRGMTVDEINNNAIAHMIFVDLDAVKAYNEFRGEGNEIMYGVVAGIASDGKPVNSDGSANEKAFAYSFTDTNFSLLQIKLTGITNVNMGLYCCAYVIVDGEVSYLHNDTVKPNATVVSFVNPDGVEAVEESINVEAVIDTKEKIYA